MVDTVFFRECYKLSMTEVKILSWSPLIKILIQLSPTLKYAKTNLGRTSNTVI